MDIHEALYTTRAMRRLHPDPIPLDAQARILDAAIRAPHIGQQWRFLLVDDRALMQELGELYAQSWEAMFADHGMTADQAMQMPGPEGASARSGAWLAAHFATVPLVLIGFSRSRDGAGIYPALWNAMLAARAEGIGSTMTTVVQTYRQAEARALLGVPDGSGWFMQGMIPMGYPRGRWGIAARKPLHDVVARNSWEGAAGFAGSAPRWPPSDDAVVAG